MTLDNEHLGLNVSGVDEEIKNVNKNIRAARDSTGCFFSPVKSNLIHTGAFIALNEERRVSFFH